MAPTLYQIAGSPPCRAVFLLCKATNFNVVYKHVNVVIGEHKTPEFTKLNPEQTVPTLQDDDGFVIWDSHAIMIYLLEKYIKNDSLYPKDPKKKSIVNQRLFFESTILFPRLRALTVKIIRDGSKEVPQEKLEDIKEGFGWAETFLEKTNYFAGNELTIADFSIVATVTSLMYFVPISPNTYPRLSAWLKRMESLPYYKEANQDGTNKLHQMLNSKLQK